MRLTPSSRAVGISVPAVRTTSSAVSGSTRLPAVYPVMEENTAPVALSAFRSLVRESHSSTSNPASWMRRTRSAKGRSVNTISAQTASRIRLLPWRPAGTATGPPCLTESMQASAMARARRASAAPGVRVKSPDGGGVPSRRDRTTAAKSASSSV